VKPASLPSKRGDLMKKLNEFFESKIEFPRIKFSKTQAVETLINEGALLFVKFLRNELDAWIPRISIPGNFLMLG
jgi:hypothetical protein